VQPPQHFAHCIVHGLRHGFRHPPTLADSAYCNRTDQVPSDWIALYEVELDLMVSAKALCREAIKINVNPSERRRAPLADLFTSRKPALFVMTSHARVVACIQV
jgi:hypothetical protein